MLKDVIVNDHVLGSVGKINDEQKLAPQEEKTETETETEAKTNTNTTNTKHINPVKRNNPLVAFMGISEYDSNAHENLPGVKIDCVNAMKCFNTKLKYTVLCLDKNNKIIYEEKDQSNDFWQGKHFKFRWNANDIDGYLEIVRKHLVKKQHDSLIFIISCHGDTDYKIYDSEGEEYEEEALLAMFTSIASALLESYEETEAETNSIIEKSKVFLIDRCRGDTSLKAIDVKKNTNNEENSNGSEKKDSVTTKGQTGNTEEKYTTKAISHAQTNRIFAPSANFCIVRANIKGYTVAEGDKNGGMFLQSVYKEFPHLDTRLMGLDSMVRQFEDGQRNWLHYMDICLSVLKLWNL